jgi:tetraacyldisaccharide 4'-kinase
VLSTLLRYRRRAARTDRQAVRLRRPVISIGNISMGGRGKTPLAGLVARLLVEAGERPAILSRGYGRAIVDDGVTVVSDGRTPIDRARLADADHSGDEPLMLARMVPGAAVLVCEQRALAGTLAETVLGSTVHVLDDGFQHFQLHRDIDIVLVSPEDFSASVAPFGRLREPVDALQDADAIVIDGPAGSSIPPRFSSASFTGTLVRRLLGPEPALAAGARVVAVAGIATPSRFFAALTDAGWSLAETLPFRDHHLFSTGDARRIAASASSHGAAAIVTTSKDAIRLESLGPWPVPVVEIPLDVAVDPAAGFRSWLLHALERRRRGEVSLPVSLS